MLEFFRKYQWYFFLVITVAVVISFSFFGTYSTLSSNNNWREQTAFKAIDGQSITRLELDEMAVFLATDNEDKLLYGGVWGPNFLNDGVILKDFLETGLAYELVRSYQNELNEDLQKRLDKEKRYKLYTHPQAPFLSVVNVWNYLQPNMATYLSQLQSAQNATDPEAFKTRVQLFLTEKKVPAYMLNRMLRYQENQYSWITPDPNLDHMDLSLFGYHTLEDWFGPRFTRLVSQFIINSAILAEEKGYKVTKAEAISDLIRQADISYQQNKQNPQIGVATPQEYFNEQLRRLNMDQARAVKVWRQVLLFRRYFQDVGHAALVDPLMYQNFHQVADESVSLDRYRLPAALHINDYANLQKLEFYLEATTKRSNKDPLAIPTTFLTAKEVRKKYPELVQKRYLLEIAQVDKKNLQSRISLKDTWKWEMEESNWAALKKQFPELGVKKAETRDERFAAIDSLSSVTRSKVDAFARAAIIDKHPEWVEEALKEAQSQVKVIGLRLDGNQAPLVGLEVAEKRQELIELLDQVAVGDEAEADARLQAFTPNQQNYYRIRVLERELEPEILTFSEARADGTLDQVRDRVLEEYYLAKREDEPLLYQKEDESWKDFESVKGLVTDQYFAKLLKNLQKLQKTLAKENDSASHNRDQAASLRFYNYIQQAKARLEQGESIDQMARLKSDASTKETDFARAPLADQWLLEKDVYRLKRGAKEATIDQTEALTLALQQWSTIKTPVNGDLTFFQVQERGIDPKEEVAVVTKIREAHAILSADAQRVLARQVLQQLADKQAISLDYLQAPVEEAEPSVQESPDAALF